MIDSSASQEKQPSKIIHPQNFQEQVSTENVTDRLLRPIEINQKLEGKYELFESMLKVSAATINGKEGDLDKWFVSHLNDCFKDNPKFQGITTEDIGSLTLITEAPVLKKFREIYGYNYHRPVFLLSLKDYRTINNKLCGGKSDGMAFSGGNLDSDPMTKDLSMIVTGRSITDTIKHETKHTLDPQLTQKKRHGRDVVIEEFVAYWGDIIIPTVSTTVYRTLSGDKLMKEETRTREETTTIRHIKSNMESDTYKGQYGNIFNNEKEYINTVGEIAGYIQKLQGKYDKFQIDRILMNVVKIEDLKNCIKEQNL